MNERAFRYASKYCEENIWFLCQDQKMTEYKRQVVFISNANRACSLWHQKASPSPRVPVLWDYHVVLLCQQQSWMFWDLDTELGLPIGADTYLEKTFEFTDTVLRDYAPLFRVVDVPDFIETFSSDRSHMIDGEGQWLAPPPDWAPITVGDSCTLDRFIDMSDEWVGEVMTLDEMLRRYGNRRMSF